MRRISGIRRTTLTIPTDTLEWLKEIGEGNISKAIRILHRDNKNIEYLNGRRYKKNTPTN